MILEAKVYLASCDNCQRNEWFYSTRSDNLLPVGWSMQHVNVQGVFRDKQICPQCMQRANEQRHDD